MCTIHLPCSPSLPPSSDYERVITHYVQHYRYQEALRVLSKKASSALEAPEKVRKERGREEGEREGGRERKRGSSLSLTPSALTPFSLPSHCALFSSFLPLSLYLSLPLICLPPSLPPSLSPSLSPSPFLPPLTNSLLPLLRSGKEGSSVTPTSSTSSLPCS